ncbi:OmpH family outer membrane protein [Maridesulfovibrio hydrothermalis]|uniref:Outer membrane chaperone Skp (OmpH) n=1 Tax=Maridesulfovibrio hydrothermalis AM13 = DSM 14728 TaxID=1121451 RepID=L0R8Y1_9BACT|nr:OmpH family outer membrane protein [Maridesulfovibrio hydrothermalis]CCO22031.1 Outer membrane chaperone Skp (OmpH) [Maridesulfovibrio hydrothermalis AM13 = DSM 14728]
MYKKILKLTLIIAMAAFIAGCQQQASSGAKVGFVDTQKVFKECKAGTEGMEYLKNASEEFQSTFTEMQKELAGNQTEENTQKFQAALGEYQNKMGAEQNRIIEALQNGFTKAVDEYRTANGYSAILSTESAISYDKDADISDKIIEAMNKMAIKIKPE